MPAAGCHKKRPTGRYQLQFSLTWVQYQLRGKRAERWRAEIMSAFREASPAVRVEWRASFASQKLDLMKKTLTVDNRSGRRFDRDAYCAEAQEVYGSNCVPADASPKLLARCFEHSVDFIVNSGLLNGLSGAGGRAPSVSTPTISTQDSVDMEDQEAQKNVTHLEDLKTRVVEHISPSTSGDPALSAHTEHIFVSSARRSPCLAEPCTPCAIPDSAMIDGQRRFLNSSLCLSEVDEDELMAAEALFDNDSLHDLLSDPTWDNVPKCEPSRVNGDLVMCSSGVSVLGEQSRSCSSCEAELAATRLQRDDALKRCAELQSQVERLRIEREALWGSVDDCFDGCFSRMVTWGWTQLVWRVTALHNSLLVEILNATYQGRRAAASRKVDRLDYHEVFMSFASQPWITQQHSTPRQLVASSLQVPPGSLQSWRLSSLLVACRMAGKEQRGRYTGHNRI